MIWTQNLGSHSPWQTLEGGQGGASPKSDIATWRHYYSFLRGLRLVESTGTGLHLAPAGVELRSDPTTQRLAIIFADRIRLFAEVLAIIAREPLTVDEVDERIRVLYRTSWENNSGTRSRMDWQEVLGLIEAVGGRRWQITTSGREILQNRLIVTPEAFDEAYEQVVEIAEPPAGSPHCSENSRHPPGHTNLAAPTTSGFRVHHRIQTKSRILEPY